MGSYFDKLEAIHKTLETLGRDILTNDFDLKTTLTGIIVVLKEITEYEIEQWKYESKKNQDSATHMHT